MLPADSEQGLERPQPVLVYWPTSQHRWGAIVKNFWGNEFLRTEEMGPGADIDVYFQCLNCEQKLFMDASSHGPQACRQHKEAKRAADNA